MRTIKYIVSFLGLLCLSIISCKKDGKAFPEEISQTVKDKIFALGFSTMNAQKIDEGWLVEGDIVLSESDLDRIPQMKFLRIAGNEQYRTFNLITGLPRTLTVSLSSKLPSNYGPALDEAIRRYNAENLQLHFQRVSGNADINLMKVNGNFLATSGFPSSSGIPYGTIKINPGFIGSGNNSSFINYLATIMAHEIGHCIGFRHTDYMNRSFSCGHQAVNEGASSAGAVYITGTPADPDAASWMLACIRSTQNRPFNSNDKTALNYLY